MLFLIRFIILIVFSVSYSSQATVLQPIKLHSREEFTPIAFELSKEEWHWLGKKQSVNVAVYGPDSPPYRMLIEPNLYEGISADYSLMLLSNLGLRFQIYAYPDRASAYTALELGDVDLIIDDSGGQAPPEGSFLFSTSYMPDRPALVTAHPSLTSKPVIDSNAKVAVTDNYLTDDWIRSHIPNVQIQRYTSAEQALSSVAFGDNHYFIGNLSMASFQIDRNFSTTLSIAQVYLNQETGPHFVFRTEDSLLHQAVNKLLAAIPESQHKAFFHQWSQGPDLWRFSSPIRLTEREKRWLAMKQDIRVVINPLYAPFTTLNAQDQFTGIAAEILRLIHLRTGINFQILEVESVSSMFESVHQNRGDFMAAMSYSLTRDKQLLFTRPYLSSPFVLVARVTREHETTLSNMTRVAIVENNATKGWLKERYPQLQFVDAENASVALQLANEGKVDAAVTNLISANYMIDRYFRGELKVVKRIGDEPAKIAFAVGRDQPELYSILNKSLSVISPRELSFITNKWMGAPEIEINTWNAYRKEFYWLAGIFVLLVLTSFFWNFRLHREVRLRKSTQRQLQEQAIFLETMLDSAPVPVYIIDRNGRTISRNPVWHHYFQSIDVNIIQSSLKTSGHPLHDIYLTLKLAMDHNAHPITLNQRYTIFNGLEERVILHHASSFAGNDETIAGLICSWEDITEHELVKAELSEARERAEQANRTKSIFLATMSHEIRTPISAIIGLLELAVTSPEEDKSLDRDSVRVAYESAQSLMSLVGDILDMAKIESGKLELHPEWITFDTIARPVVRIFDGLARQKGITLQYHQDVLHPDEVYLDVMRLRQILSNLISNAIKFTEQGTVEVQLRCLQGSSGDERLKLVVSDTGSGIAAEDQKWLFDPYVQSKEGKKINQSTGLGLAICAQLTEMMQGNIRLHSQLGKGTRIEVKIPIRHRKSQEKTSKVTAITPTASHSLHVLAVDDHSANRLLLTQQLRRLGHYVVSAENGKQALELYDQHAFDIVITDCNMPEMGGVELTQRLRNHQRNSVIILGLTANAQPEERTRCLEAGMDECLFKPLPLQTLRTLLHKYDQESSAHQITPVLASLVNLEALLRLTNQDHEMMNTLLKATLEENTRDVTQLQHSFDNKDWSGLGHWLHRLAGSAQIIGASTLEQQCRALESECKSQEISTELELKFEELLVTLKILNQSINTYLHGLCIK